MHPSSVQNPHTQNLFWLVTRILFFINAAFWIVLALTTISRPVNAIAAYPVVQVIFSAMMIGNGLLFLFFGLIIHKSWKWAMLMAVGFLVVNILLTITDQFGLYDLLTMIIDIVLLGLVGVRLFILKD